MYSTKKEKFNETSKTNMNYRMNAEYFIKSPRKIMDLLNQNKTKIDL